MSPKVVVLDRSSERVLRILEGFVSTSGVALDFVSSERLLTVDGRGDTQLWNPQSGKTIWSAKLPIRPKLLQHAKEAPVFIAATGGASAWVCSLRTGAILWKARSIKFMHTNTPVAGEKVTNPLFIGKGTYALWTETDTADAHLIRSTTGEMLLSFVLLTPSEWIVYTPDGYWDGTEGAIEHINCWSGRQLVPGEQLRLRRAPQRIQQILGMLR